MYRIYVQEDVSPTVLGSSKKGDLEDPQQVYNRDREQMERSLDSLRRAMKTEAIAHRRDLGKMMRESVLLTKELNMLRKSARSLQLQKKAIDQAGELTVQANLMQLVELLGLQNNKKEKVSVTGGDDSSSRGQRDSFDHVPSAPDTGAPTRFGQSEKQKGRPALLSRSAALRTTSANGVVSKSGGGEKKRNEQSRQDQWEAWREIQIQYDHMKELEDRISEVCNALGLDPTPVIVAIDNKINF
jgi:hypothetical protein